MDKIKIKKRLEADFKFAWFDFWVGFYWDKEKKILYSCPLPMFLFVFRFEEVGICPICKYPMKKIAHDTGDGWTLEWNCITFTPAKSHQYRFDGDLMFIEWPFPNKKYATGRDLEAIGFEIV